MNGPIKSGRKNLLWAFFLAWVVFPAGLMLLLNLQNVKAIDVLTLLVIAGCTILMIIGTDIPVHKGHQHRKPHGHSFEK